MAPGRAALLRAPRADRDVYIQGISLFFSLLFLGCSLTLVRSLWILWIHLLPWYPFVGRLRTTLDSVQNLLFLSCVSPF